MKTTEILNLHRALKHLGNEETEVGVSINRHGATILVTTKKGQARTKNIPFEQLIKFDNAGVMLGSLAEGLVKEL